MGKKIAVISALGGQGVTLASAYLLRAMDAGHTVAAVDLCGFGGTLAYMLGVGEETVFHIGDVVRGACELEEALVDSGGRTKLLPSCAFSDTFIAPCAVEARRIVEELARQGDVIADMPAGTVPDCGAAGCFDLFVLCSHADGLSLKYAAALCRLIRQKQAETGRGGEIRLLLTDFSPDAMKDGGIADIDACIDTAGARLLGVMPHDRSALRSALAGQPPDERCELMRYARDAARRIFGEKVPLDARTTLADILKNKWRGIRGIQIFT